MCHAKRYVRLLRQARAFPGAIRLLGLEMARFGNVLGRGVGRKSQHTYTRAAALVAGGAAIVRGPLLGRYEAKPSLSLSVHISLTDVSVWEVVSGHLSGLPCLSTALSGSAREKVLSSPR